MSNDALTIGSPLPAGADQTAPAHPKSAASPLPAASVLLRVLRREPLFHFAVLGALIFGADAVLHPPVNDDHVIVVTKARRQAFIDNFDEDRERTPSDAQLQSMINNWVGSEILYREGKRLGVDLGDETIRDRVAFKLQVMIFDQAQAALPTEEELRTWFAANHAQFDDPETVGFYLTRSSDEATARQWLKEIEEQSESEELQRQTRTFPANPVASLAPVFGKSFSDALLALPQGQWAVLQSKEGWHVARLDSRRPGKLASLDDIRDEATRIWRTNETRKRAWEAVGRLKTNYTVRYEQ